MFSAANFASTSTEELRYRDDHFGTSSMNSSAPFGGSGLARAESISASSDVDESRIVIEHLLREREAEFIELQTLKVFIGSWNVNGQHPGGDSLLPWLSCSQKSVDLYAIGFQELDLNQQAYVFANNIKEQIWANMIASTLQSVGDYVELKRVRLVGIFLLIFVRRPLLKDVKHSSFNSVPTGFLGYLGNKGGVAVSIKLNDSWLCFVNSHLAAHNDELDRRNQDFKDISERLRFNLIDGTDLTSRSQDLQDTMTILDHDVVFWMGDLNYRLQTSTGQNLDVAMVRQRCSMNDFESLLQYDQLRMVQGKQLAFSQFTEGPVRFMPTYKYDPGTDNWDTSEKCRCPAWCDRILWRKEDSVEQHAYFSVPQLKLSDHKPVVLYCSIKVKRKEPAKFNKVLREATREADRRANEFLPQVLLDKHDIQFGDVKFFETRVESLTLTNTGQCDVVFTFRPPPGREEFHKTWLLISPTPPHLVPRGKSCRIDFQVTVYNEDAWKLNSGVENLLDILVLHLQRGKDLFITVSGNYCSSCFGSSIRALVDQSRPVKVEEVPTGNLLDLDFADSSAVDEITSPDPDAMFVPHVVVRLVEHLRRNALDKENLFQEAGRISEFSSIREALDNNSKLSASTEAIAEALYRLLDSFSESVIPSSFFEQFSSALTNFAFMSSIINSKIPPEHKAVFKYLVRFLREVIRNQKNETVVDVISEMFGPVLLKPVASTLPAQRETLSSTAQKQRIRQISVQFLKTFLVTEDAL